MTILGYCFYNDYIRQLVPMVIMSAYTLNLEIIIRHVQFNVDCFDSRRERFFAGLHYVHGEY